MENKDQVPGTSPEKETPKKTNKISKKLADEGFHNCTRVHVVKDSKNNITKLGDTVNKIKAMHESNIDEYNGQQVNSGMFIKKDGAKYELVDVTVQGRKAPLKMFMEITK